MRIMNRFLGRVILSLSFTDQFDLQLCSLPQRLQVSQLLLFNFFLFPFTWLCEPEQTHVLIRSEKNSSSVLFSLRSHNTGHPNIKWVRLFPNTKQGSASAFAHICWLVLTSNSDSDYLEVTGQESRHLVDSHHILGDQL